MSQNLVDLANGNAGSNAVISISPRDARAIARLAKKHNFRADLRKIGGTDMMRAKNLCELVNLEYGENTIRVPEPPSTLEEKFEESEDSLLGHMNQVEESEERTEFQMGTHRDTRENHQVPGARRRPLEEYVDIKEEDEDEEDALEHEEDHSHEHPSLSDEETSEGLGERSRPVSENPENFSKVRTPPKRVVKTARPKAPPKAAPRKR